VGAAGAAAAPDRDEGGVPPVSARQHRARAPDPARADGGLLAARAGRRARAAREGRAAVPARPLARRRAPRRARDAAHRPHHVARRHAPARPRLGRATRAHPRPTARAAARRARGPADWPPTAQPPAGAMQTKQRDSRKSRRRAPPGTFMPLPYQTDPAGVDVAILGVPFDSGTSYRSGARMGPREIRAQSSLIRLYSYFLKVSPFETLTVVDAGDVDAPPVGIEPAYAAIQAGVARILDANAMPLVVGGDHSISLPCLRAVAAKHGPVALVQFDAHMRTGGDYFGGKYFHGSPFRRAIEERLIDPKRFVQVGIRGPMYGEEEDFGYQRDLGVTTIDIGMVKRDAVGTTIARVRDIV